MLAIPASNDEKYIDSKGIPTAPGEYPDYLCIFYHLKLGIVLAIPASNATQSIECDNINCVLLNYSLLFFAI